MSRIRILWRLVWCRHSSEFSDVSVVTDPNSLTSTVWCRHGSEFSGVWRDIKYNIRWRPLNSDNENFLCQIGLSLCTYIILWFPLSIWCQTRCRLAQDVLGFWSWFELSPVATHDSVRVVNENANLTNEELFEYCCHPGAATWSLLNALLFTRPSQLLGDDIYASMCTVCVQDIVMSRTTCNHKKKKKMTLTATWHQINFT